MIYNMFVHFLYILQMNVVIPEYTFIYTLYLFLAFSIKIKKQNIFQFSCH